MSLASMTEVALQRRSDIGTSDFFPRTLREVAGATEGKEKPDSATNTALKTVTTYVPTEVITLYLAFVAAFLPPAEAPGAKTAEAARAAVAAGKTPEALFFVFLGFTPVATFLVYAAKVKTAGKPMPLPFRAWPVWEMIAATLAFTAWAVALPEQPFAWIRAAVAGVLVLATSTILGLLAPLFTRKINP